MTWGGIYGRQNAPLPCLARPFDVERCPYFIEGGNFKVMNGQRGQSLWSMCARCGPLTWPTNPFFKVHMRQVHRAKESCPRTYMVNEGTSWGSGYVYGFLVPLAIVSPYAKAGYISHATHDFGSILNFIGKAFGLPSMGYADAGSLPEANVKAAWHVQGMGPSRIRNPLSSMPFAWSPVSAMFPTRGRAW